MPELSKRKALIGCCALTATALAVAVPGASGTTDNEKAAKTPKISVTDDLFTPSTAKIKVGGKVQWVWGNANTDTHNVILTSTHPKGVKASDYRSGDASVQYKYAPKFKVAGTYKFICTYHRTVMQTTVTVKK